MKHIVWKIHIRIKALKAQSTYCSNEIIHWMSFRVWMYLRVCVLLVFMITAKTSTHWDSMQSVQVIMKNYWICSMKSNTRDELWLPFWCAFETWRLFVIVNTVPHTSRNDKKKVSAGMKDRWLRWKIWGRKKWDETNKDEVRQYEIKRLSRILILQH